MINLRDLLDVLHESLDTSTASEIKSACELIVDVQSMSQGEVDCIKTGYELGPLFDGDVPSKTDRDKLVDRRYMVKVIIKGEDGYNAVTYKGAFAYRIIKFIEHNDCR